MTFILRLARFWVLLVFIGLSGYVAYYNRGEVELSLPPLLYQQNYSTYVAFMAAFLLGATVVLVFFGLDYMKRSLEILKLKPRVLRDDPKAENQLDSDEASRTGG
jgi:hypothetical protein